MWPCGGSSRSRSRNPQTGPHRSRGRRRETAAGRSWQRPYDRQKWRAVPSESHLPTPTCRRSRRTRTASMTIAGNSQKWGAQTGPQGAGRGYPNDAAREGTGAVRRPQTGAQEWRGRAAPTDRVAGCTRGRAAPRRSRRAHADAHSEPWRAGPQGRAAGVHLRHRGISRPGIQERRRPGVRGAVASPPGWEVYVVWGREGTYDVFPDAE